MAKSVKGLRKTPCALTVAPPLRNASFQSRRIHATPADVSQAGDVCLAGNHAWFFTRYWSICDTLVLLRLHSNTIFRRGIAGDFFESSTKAAFTGKAAGKTNILDGGIGRFQQEFSHINS